MKYEIKRLYDSTRFEGNGSIRVIGREEKLRVGDVLVPRSEEYSHELEEELLTGTIGVLFDKGKYKSTFSHISDILVGLEGIVNVADLSKRYEMSEDYILSKFFNLSSQTRERILSEISGSTILLDDIQITDDKGRIGVIWFPGGDFIFYSPDEDKILLRENLGLGWRYGNCGKHDYLAKLREIENQRKELYYDDLLSAFHSIRDWDYYHWADD